MFGIIALVRLNKYIFTILRINFTYSLASYFPRPDSEKNSNFKVFFHGVRLCLSEPVNGSKTTSFYLNGPFH